MQSSLLVATRLPHPSAPLNTHPHQRGEKRKQRKKEGRSVGGRRKMPITISMSTLFTSCCHLPRRSQGTSNLGGKQQRKLQDEQESERFHSSLQLGRRKALAMAATVLAQLGRAGEGSAATQGLLAGRIPGLSDADEDGWRTYMRPEDKSGGHGVGWSPIIPYLFKVPDGWEEVPVSIADLGGTEIDLRFASAKEGKLFVIVAPVRRFADIDGDATIQQIGTPERVISAFGPEVIGENVEGRVLSSETAEFSGRTYYRFELEPPHALITATAAGNRLYLFSVLGNGLQWKRHYADLKRIANSFRVV